ncbi:hypothetical protein SAMN04488072_102159 [Lentibacillus halodurans]|uniref:Uncharacterized protein n=1 Tax=Lentibacillus halodurans TaxID=237679 RepID=A0A1I0W2B2_9BACI|nr:hypothetical protein [Lentibacillus halodurans]SFA82849.1 hypothetical protein SAMN04488072_102159 [Lentibacillus halodurans]
MESLNELYSFDGNKEGMVKKSVESIIKDSGNSDVDISILIDTTPMAYAMLCSLLSTNQLTRHEFEKAVRKLEDLTRNNDHYFTGKNDVSTVRLKERGIRR